jgi:hypothetical protein
LNSSQHNLDCTIQATGTSVHSLDVDVEIKADQTDTHDLDAIVQTVAECSHSLDVVIQIEFSEGHNLDVTLQFIEEANHDLDAIIQTESSFSHGLDCVLLALATSVHFLDSSIQAVSDVSHDLDVVVQTEQNPSHDLDALIFVEETESHELDVYLQTGSDRQHRLDADIFAETSVSHSLDAYLLSFALEVIHELDVYLQAQPSVTHELDVVIQIVYLQSRVHTLDAALVFGYEISHSIDVWVEQAPGRPSVTTKDILLPSLKILLPSQQFITEDNCVSVNTTFNLTGGSFSVSLIRNTTVLPPEDTVLTLPNGRFAVVKNVGRGSSTGGLVDTISGPILPYAATVRTFVAMLNDATPIGYGYDILASTLAARFGLPAQWLGADGPMRSYNFRGQSLQGIQQLAGNFLNDVIVYKNTIYVVNAGEYLPLGIGEVWIVGDDDLVSLNQSIDYTSDHPVYLNPLSMNLGGQFIYDEQHARKQSRTTVQAGSPLGTGGTDFIPIPDGWMVEGSYEEWAPDPASTDLSNPSPSVPRYWKEIPSPSTPGNMRGITYFTRLVKDMNLPAKSGFGSVSTFVASPVTAGNQDGPNVFLILGGSIENGLFGFSADEEFVSDILTDTQVDVKTALVLYPPSGQSATADIGFYSVPMELWTFPKAVPMQTLAPGADPTNPNAIPPEVEIFTQSNSVKLSASFINTALAAFAKRNSPKMQTSVSQIYHGQLPQPGDHLMVPSAAVSDCGRINTVSLNLSRGGVVISISAEVLGNGRVEGEYAVIPSGI